MRVTAAVLALLLTGGGTTAAADGPEAGSSLPETLQRVGRRLEQWYSRAQTVVSRESVSIQPLGPDLSPDGFARRLDFDLRVSWDPASGSAEGLPDATVLRDIVRVNGRPAAAQRDSGCMDPKPVSPEPLTMLLPARLDETEFSLAGIGRVDGRASVMIDYRGRRDQPAGIDWTDECVTVSLPGRSKGRVWVDAETYDVLRLDDRLEGWFEFNVPGEFVRRGAARSMIIERAETSIRYKLVAFQDPSEMLMLPVSVETLTVIRGTEIQRVRISQRFTDHRRFLTVGRLVD
ncbi:MAG: hypothetical protein A3F70_17390 [Acidobacteria bacterium RIFCSPLOWO2_12_FULL_67_14]|nr:MAG: hypothetical protein A3H29_07965 [Acidobacteria bacterium RIFCSPLOWO2_02_FULL_67_21]OFW35958.1 MAG: hypothetical protein A3F70_17390 [Acidobacteria bacterium RIFCSPLOWO2_12_FULL_67_14]